MQHITKIIYFQRFLSLCCCSWTQTSGKSQTPVPLLLVPIQTTYLKCLQFKSNSYFFFISLLWCQTYQCLIWPQLSSDGYNNGKCCRIYFVILTVTKKDKLEVAACCEYHNTLCVCICMCFSVALGLCRVTPCQGLLPPMSARRFK